MKRLVVILVLMVAPMVGCASYPTAQVSVKVTDTEGDPVEGAEVGAAFRDSGTGSDDREGRYGITNRNGVTDLQGKLNYISLSVYANKDGYYRSRKKVTIGTESTGFKKDVSFVLRKKINPVPMYAKIESAELPERNERFGYDFFKGDIVHETRSGVRPDMYIHVERPVFEGEFEDFEEIITISFPGKKDGIQFFEPPRESEDSEFTSHYKAPEDGYKDEVVVKAWRDNGIKRMNTERPAYLRIRSETDDEGNIKSAHYCKVKPGFFPAGVYSQRPVVKFTYYCNPTANDRGMEYKMKHSLVPGTNSQNRPRKP